MTAIAFISVPADHKKKKKTKKKTKRIWKVVTDTFGTVTKRLLKGLEDLEVGRREETIQITALLRTLLRIHFCVSTLSM